MRVYRTFEEIDRELKILRLQSKIEKEQLKIGVARVKEDFSPVSMVGNFVGGFAKKAVLLKMVSGIIGRLKK
ncbi:MAG TPA: DUF6327 family protein [Flavobacteriaceae bacterium]|nr:DUF6327 family protein [Flavobacteriaceae bacterium]